MSDGVVSRLAEEGPLLAITWRLGGDGDHGHHAGEPKAFGWLVDKMVHVFGEFGGTGVVSLLGSSSPDAEPVPLRAWDGGTLRFKYPDMERVPGHPGYLWPVLDEADAMTDVTVVVTGRRP